MTNVFEKHSAKLTGVWSLLTYEMFDSEGPDRKLLSKPHGDEPLGKVVISKSGYLSAILVPSSVLSPLPSDYLMEASDEALARICRRLSTYSGFMTLLEREDGGFLWHTMVEVSNNPNWVGKEQTRRVDYFEDNGEAYMILRPVKDYLFPVGSSFPELVIERQRLTGGVGW